jgi:hypothetical protein
MRSDESTLVISATGDPAISDILASPHHREQIGLFEVDPSIPTQPLSPPKLAAYLLYLFLSKHDRENIPGDLAEEYETIILPEFGLRRATLWFWKQVFCSIWPVIAPRLKRIITVSGIAEAAYDMKFSSASGHKSFAGECF